jgi:hypothetical protein
MRTFFLLSTLTITTSFILFVVVHRRKTRKAAAEWAGRSPMGDEAFLAACDVGADPVAARVALAARRVIARLATVPPTTVLPDDSFARDLVRLPFWDSLDWLGFDLELEKELGCDVWISHLKWQGTLKPLVGFRNLLVRHVVYAVATTAVISEERETGE